MAYDYTSMINAANQTYKDTLAGYQKTLADTQAQQKMIMDQYNVSAKQALDLLKGTEQAAMTAANKKYQEESGRLQGGFAGHFFDTTAGPNLNRRLLSDYGDVVKGIQSEYGGRYSGLQQQQAQTALQAGITGLGQQQAINLAQAGLMGQFGLAQGQQALGYAGLGTQERGQDIGLTTAREQMSNQRAMAEAENAARIQAAYAGRSLGGGGGGGGGGSGVSSSLSPFGSRYGGYAGGDWTNLEIAGYNPAAFLPSARVGTTTWYPQTTYPTLNQWSDIESQYSRPPLNSPSWSGWV